jgi:RHS repeat-associated protein
MSFHLVDANSFTQLQGRNDDEWNVVLVLNGLDSNAVKQKYTWGLDLSGQAGDGSTSGIHGAGGIGGLLAAVETGGANPGSYWFLYDGNGNVGQVLNATNQQSITVAAKYEYDPYGNVIGPDPDNDGDWLEHAGPYAATNPFRFSTKWFDAEVDYPSTSNDGLYYFGRRYYLPRLGRWGSRDPIEERGGANLYGFVDNSPGLKFDRLGLFIECFCEQRPPKPNPCADCWQTCLQNQGLLGNIGGAVICRADGCECACTRQSQFNPGDPCDKAMEQCQLKHEEKHVSSKRCSCSCSPKPCLKTKKSGCDGKDEECDASAVEINCLCPAKKSFAGNPGCIQKINSRITQMEQYCLNQKCGGGDVYKHGASRCP